MKIFSSIRWVAVLGIVAATASAWAADGNGSLDAASQEALTKTLMMLNSPVERSEAIKGSATAEYANRQVESVAGGSPEITNDIYALASEITQTLVQESGGDVSAMMALLEKAKNNPKAFAEKLSPAQRKHLSEIAAKIQAKNGISAGASTQKSDQKVR